MALVLDFARLAHKRDRVVWHTEYREQGSGVTSGSAFISCVYMGLAWSGPRMHALQRRPIKPSSLFREQVDSCSPVLRFHRGQEETRRKGTAGALQPPSPHAVSTPPRLILGDSDAATPPAYALAGYWPAWCAHAP
jgi:hypothetical protein